VEGWWRGGPQAHDFAQPHGNQPHPAPLTPAHNLHKQVNRREEEDEDEEEEEMEVVGHVDKDEDEDEFEDLDLVDLGRRDEEGKRRASTREDENLLLAARAGVRVGEV